MSEVRPFVNLHPLDRLGNQPVQIGIALAVGMAHHVHRDAVDEDREVRAMIRVEATEKNLIRLAAAVVLPQDQAWHKPKHVGRSIGRAQFQVAGPACSFGGRRCGLLAPDVDFDGRASVGGVCSKRNRAQCRNCKNQSCQSHGI